MAHETGALVRMLWGSRFGASMGDVSSSETS